MSRDDRKAEREREVVHGLLTARGFDERAFTLESQKPPEPDVRATFADGDQVAFEVVELVDQRFLRSLDRSDIDRALRGAYATLPEPQRSEYSGRLYLIRLREDAALKSVQRCSLELVKELRNASLGRTSSFPRGSKLAQYAEKLDVQQGASLAPDFMISRVTYVASQAALRISDKLDKNYNRTLPIELVAFIEWHDSFNSEADLPEALRAQLSAEERCSPFRRIWIVDLRQGQVVAVFPSTEAADLAAREGWSLRAGTP